MEGLSPVPKQTSEMEYFTNSQYQELGSNFIKQTKMLTPDRCPEFFCSFTLELAEVVLSELFNTVHLLSFGLSSNTRLRTFKHYVQHIFESDYQGDFFTEDFCLEKRPFLCQESLQM